MLHLSALFVHSKCKQWITNEARHKHIQGNGYKCPLLLLLPLPLLSLRGINGEFSNVRYSSSHSAKLIHHRRMKFLLSTCFAIFHFQFFCTDKCNQSFYVSVALSHSMRFLFTSGMFQMLFFWFLENGLLKCTCAHARVLARFDWILYTIHK